MESVRATSTDSVVKFANHPATAGLVATLRDEHTDCWVWAGFVEYEALTEVDLVLGFIDGTGQHRKAPVKAVRVDIWREPQLVVVEPLPKHAGSGTITVRFAGPWSALEIPVVAKSTDPLKRGYVRFKAGEKVELPVGEYRVETDPAFGVARGVFDEEVVDIVAGVDTSITFEGRTEVFLVRLRVVPPPGRPLPGAVVRARRDGRVLCHWMGKLPEILDLYLPEGDMQLTVGTRDYLRAITELARVGGSTSPMEVRIQLKEPDTSR